MNFAGSLLGTLLAAPPSISVGVVSANLMHLGRDIAQLEQAGARLLHFDVMDDCLVPLLTVGPPFIQQVTTAMLKDVHLMVSNPMEKVKHYIAAGADLLTVHIESCPDLRPVLQRIGEMFNANDPSRGVLRGVGIFPDTPLSSLEPLLDSMEMVVLLAVDPRGGTQPTMEKTMQRALQLKAMIAQHGHRHLLCVDGGIKLDNIDQFAKMGANLLVSGSAVFKGALGDNLYALHAAIGGLLAVPHEGD